ncbi:MAG: ArnT family glycosyltransferase [Anaerolineaceae bacterium]
MKKKCSTYLILLLMLMLSILGAALVFYATTWGPWAFSDSAAYLSCARNFNAGLGISMTRADGLITPLTLFPPGYAFMLSRLAMLAGDYILAARIMDAVSFGLLIFTITWGSLVLSENILIALASGLLVLAAPVMLENFTGLMSEPLFIFLFYGSFFFTQLSIQKQKDHWFILAILFSALAPLVRYIGVMLCALNPLILLIFSKSPWKEKMRKAVLFGSLTILPIAIWFIESNRTAHTFGGRSIIFPAEVGQKLLTFLKDAFAILRTWIPYMGYRVNLVPDGSKVGIVLGALGTILALDLFFYLKKRKTAPMGIMPRWMFSAILYIVVYLMVLAFSYLFASMPPDLNSRMFSPLWPALVMLCVCGSAFLIEQFAIPWKKPATILMMVVLLLPLRFYALRTWANARDMHENGYGFTSRAIQTSGFLQAVEGLPDDTPLIANTPALVLFYTNRMPYELTPIPSERLGNGNTSIDLLFSTQNAALIVDYASLRNTYTDWKPRLEALTAGLDVAFQDEMGGIYSFLK